MAITCNFERDNDERNDEKVLQRVLPAQAAGEEAPAMRPVKHGAYLWNLSPRRRTEKSWRDISHLN